MTIAIGILASDGIVISADSQLTIQNYWKGSHGKIMALERVKIPGGFFGACVVTGATNDFPYLVSLGQDILGVFEKQIKDQPDTSLDGPLRKVVKQFQKDHVAPYPEIGVELIVATSRPFADELWSTKRSIISSHTSYIAVGIGAATADALLDRLWRQSKYDVAAAVALAVFVTLAVKDSVDGCGKVTNVIILQGNAFLQVPKPVIQRLEDQFSAYFENHEPQLVRLLLGVESTPLAAALGGSSDASEFLSQAINGLREELRRTIEGIRSTTPNAQIHAARKARAAAQSGPSDPTPDPTGQPPSQE